MDIEKLHKDIKKIMIDKDINNNDLALKLEQSKQYASKLLKQNSYTLSTLERIADALECELVIKFENIEEVKK